VIAARKNCYNYLVFHKIRSLLETNRQNYFGSIPSGVDVTIISFEVNGEKIYLASKKAVTQNTIVESLDYVQVDESHFREELEKRLKF
jgi:ribosomal protein L13